MAGDEVPGLLVTGFGPFPGVAVNPSAALARRVGASVRLRLALGAPPAVRVLRTSYGAISGELAPALAATSGAVLMIGVAARARRLRVEGRAVNRASALAPDVDGAPARCLRLDPDGPPARRGAMPAQALAVLRRHGVPARASNDAGRYLCNAAYYRALAAPRAVLFVHVPRAGKRRPRRAGREGREGPIAPERVALALVEIAVRLGARERARRGG